MIVSLTAITVSIALLHYYGKSQKFMNLFLKIVFKNVFLFVKFDVDFVKSSICNLNKWKGNFLGKQLHKPLLRFLIITIRLNKRYGKCYGRCCGT